MHDTTRSDPDRSVPTRNSTERLPNRTECLPDPTECLPDPAPIAAYEDVHTSIETITHERHDHAGADVDGHAVVGVTNDVGELLVLIEPDRKIALLPHGTVEPGDDWAAAARSSVEGQTGVSIALDAVAAVRTVVHLVDGSEHTTTHRIVYSGSPTGGEIRDCKRSAAAGTDGWEARWVETLPDGVSPPEGGVGNDLEVFLG